MRFWLKTRRASNCSTKSPSSKQAHRATARVHVHLHAAPSAQICHLLDRVCMSRVAGWPVGGRLGIVELLIGCLLVGSPVRFPLSAVRCWGLLLGFAAGGCCSTGEPAWATFLQIVETKEDLYVQHQANRILVKIIIDNTALLNAASLQGYFAWVTNTIQSKVPLASGRPLSCAAVRAREEFVWRGGWVYATLRRVLRTGGTTLSTTAQVPQPFWGLNAAIVFLRWVASYTRTHTYTCTP